MISLPSSSGRLHGGPPVVIMLSFALLSRTFCQAVTQANCRAYPTFDSVFRAFTTSAPKCGDSSNNASASVVTYSQLKTMLMNRDIQLFDVRNPDEYQAGRIAEAVNIPLGTLEESLKLPPDHFEQKYEVKPPGKDDDNIVFHCKSGNRSSTALDIARRLGFSKARHYKGGYTEWVEKEGN